ncbi:hypothetical protein QBC39DRAFT_109750 [Podospora conica]|nr:hypothetical protein QBC39DRAFT_109750 [Schizothecium conicum]
MRRLLPRFVDLCSRGQAILPCRLASPDESPSSDALVAAVRGLPSFSDVGHTRVLSRCFRGSHQGMSGSWRVSYLRDGTTVLLLWRMMRFFFCTRGDFQSFLCDETAEGGRGEEQRSGWEKEGKTQKSMIEASVGVDPTISPSPEIPGLGAPSWGPLHPCALSIVARPLDHAANNTQSNPWRVSGSDILFRRQPRLGLRHDSLERVSSCYRATLSAAPSNLSRHLPKLDM